MSASAAGAGASAISAIFQLYGGISAKKTAELNAYNIETQRILGEAEASNRSTRRLEEYDANLSANIASFAKSGRDIGGSDRSVKAFLDKQRETAFEDVSDIAFGAQMESLSMRAQAAATRAEGKAKLTSAVVGAFTTAASGLSQYNQTSFGGAPTANAPQTSVRPTLRPVRG